MIINIASYGGRNWLLDLAVELDKHGHQVRFYSYLPNKRAQKFGLKKELNYSYFILALPFLALLKLSNRSHWALFLFHYFFDKYVAIFMKPCDVFIGQSPMHVSALKKARRRFGAKIILERGTSHVLNYMEILGDNPALKNKNIMPEKFLKRDLSGYQLADYISIPSEFSFNSFVKQSIPPEKLFINPYGVSLSEFKPTFLDSKNVYDIIIVGQWSYRKGCDLLIEACKVGGFKLLHVGPIIDVTFPKDLNMTHVDSVDQSKLIQYYSQSRIFVLPSREDGFGLVLPQAIICGLPIVCSKNTGGPTLRNFLSDKKWIVEMNNLDVEELIRCIKSAIKLSEQQKGLRTYSEGLENYLSWDAYGNRYNDFLNKIMNK